MQNKLKTCKYLLAFMNHHSENTSNISVIFFDSDLLVTTIALMTTKVRKK